MQYGQNPLDAENELNILSSEGWEVVTVYNNPGAIVLLKKPSDGNYEVHKKEEPGVIKAQVQGHKDISGKTTESQKDANSDSIKEAQLAFRDATSKLAKEDFEGAVILYDKAISLDPGFNNAYIFRGNAKLKLRKWGTAIEDFNKVLELKPNDIPCLINRGTCKTNAADFSGAIEDFNKVIQLDRNNLLAYEQRGLCKKANKQLDDAIKDFEHIISESPKDTEAISNIADIKFDQKKYEEAHDLYSKIIKLDGTNAIAYMKRAKVKKMLSDEEGYEADMKEYQQVCTKILKSRDTGANWGKDAEEPDTGGGASVEGEDDIKLV